MHLIAKRMVLTVATLAVVVAIVAVTSLTSGAAAQQDTPPHSFNGTANIDGNPASKGTVVSAMVDGVAVDSVAVDDAARFFDLQVAVAGKEVTFSIGELVANEKATSEVGGANVLNLTATETSYSAQATTNRQILFDLYYATQGVNWRYQTNWLSREPLNTWHGVSTGKGGIAELRLNANRLKGKIPLVLGNLSGLTRLELRGGTGSYDNQLIGNIPAELGNLVNLTHLDLGHNQLGGQIPAELGNLTSLTHLDLSNNGLTGSIPPALGNLTNLVYLDLSGNKLSGNIPSSLGQLKSSIETLRINNTGLEGCIPDDLKYVQSSSTDIPQVNLSLPFCSEYTPPPTPRATSAPGSTQEPGTSGSGNGTTPTPKPTTPIGQPTVNFHASQTEVLVGEPVGLTLSVANSIIKPEMTLQLVLQLPSGLLVSGEGGIGEQCSVQCVGTYKVSTGENKDFLITAVANQSGAFDIDGRMEWYFGNDLATTHDGDAETLRLEVVAPQLPPTPTPTPTPTPEPTLPPHVGQPTVNLHATQTKVQLGDPVKLQLSLVNSIAKPEMTLKLVLQVPSGWSMSGSGFTESCTGQCTATYQVGSGDQRSIELEMQPNQAGSFMVEAQMEWWFEDDSSTLDGKAVSLPLTVAPLTTPIPTLPPQRAAPIPTSGGGDGCFSAGGSGGPGSLMLLGLLILPVVGLMARPLLSRPLPRMARAGLAPLELLGQTILVFPMHSIRTGSHSSGRRAILTMLVIEALALALFALLLHIAWAGDPMRSNLTVLVWPITSLIVLYTVSLLVRPNMPVVLLGVPLMLWLALLTLLHISHYFADDPVLFYASDNWTSLIAILVVTGIAGIFSLRDKGLGGRTT